MLLHARFVEEPVADEEMAHEEGAPGRREHRADDGDGSGERVEERFRDRTDIALRRRIEGRAVFEQELAAILAAQPFQRGQALRDGLLRRYRAGLQGDDARLAIMTGIAAGNADELHGRHAAFRKRVGKVARPGEVVGDAAKKHCPPGSSSVRKTGRMIERDTEGAIASAGCARARFPEG